MSSATSTEPQPFQPWQFYTLAGLIGATIVVFFAKGQTPAVVILLSLVIFGAAGVGLAALRTFVPLTGSPPQSDAVAHSGRTRTALEREKTLALRAIKELEFDRAMGKVAEQDFAEMSGRLRARAARLIRQLDAGSAYRQEIEKEIARRVGRAPATAGSSDAATTTAACASCSTVNDADARFCKGCGAAMGGRS